MPLIFFPQWYMKTKKTTNNNPMVVKRSVEHKNSIIQKLRKLAARVKIFVEMTYPNSKLF